MRRKPAPPTRSSTTLHDATIEAGPLRRVRLDVSYDGTDFAGWAVQPDQRTVQSVLEAALATVLRHPRIRLIVAGRTDAGVHAIGQVAHFDLPGDLPHAMLRRLNGVLPPDVRVRAVTVVPADFEARFSALWRRYEYRITDAQWGVEPLLRRTVLAWPRSLNEGAMASAADQLLGLHDFAAFCKRREWATTVRALRQLTVERAGADITCTVVADAFCHSMVRSLVGALLAVGDGRKPIEWPASLLTLGKRASSVVVAPAHGLTLIEVGYPQDTEFAARAGQARARRELPDAGHAPDARPARDVVGVHVEVDDLSRPAVLRLLAEHLAEMHATSPAESVHALDLDALRDPAVTVWTLWDDEELLACAALKELSTEHCEVKSMRTTVAARGRGIAARLLAHLLTQAGERGYDRLSLETGTEDFFAAARRLYQRFGFVECEPFGDYELDPNSVFMTRDI